MIPARAASKGVYRKNLAKLAGRPLIEWTIDTALKSKSLSRVVVTTEDISIAEVSRKCGAETPFQRPEELAADDASDLEVLTHALDYFLKHEQYEPDLVVWLRPTSPLRMADDIDSAVQLFLDSQPDSVRSVCKVEHHPYWMYRVEDGWLSTLIEGIDVMGKYSRRQLLPDVYRLNGAVEVIDPEVIRTRKVLYGERIIAYIMPPSRSIEIDIEMDMLLAMNLMEKH